MALDGQLFSDFYPAECVIVWRCRRGKKGERVQDILNGF